MPFCAVTLTFTVFAPGVSAIGADKLPLSSTAPFTVITDDDEAAIYFSSGTTGFPKAILHKHSSLIHATECEQRHHGDHYCKSTCFTAASAFQGHNDNSYIQNHYGYGRRGRRRGGRGGRGGGGRGG